jgi:integrase
MPLKLVPPKAGRTPNWHIRGTHLRVKVNRSADTPSKRLAARLKKRIERDIERGAYGEPERAADAPVTFLDATAAYLKADGAPDYLSAITEHSGEDAIRDKPIEAISQIDIDNLAAALYPKATAQTRNRQVYTPTAAVLHHAGIQKRFKRPKGWRGSKATSWLRPEQAFDLLDAAKALDLEFWLLCVNLLYTGMRISEPLAAELRHLDLERGALYLPETKNSEARTVFLPPVVVDAYRAMPPRPARPMRQPGEPRLVAGAAGRSQTGAGEPFLRRHPRSRIFRFHQGGYLRALLKQAMAAAGLSFPRRQGAFHLFCHTYGSWMHQYAGLDNFDLTRTERWLDPRSAERYVHTDVNEEARRAVMLPVKTGT